MSATTTRPAQNPRGGNLSVDDIALRRDQQPESIYRGAFRQAWEHVKSKPVETLVLSFLYLLFTGGFGGCNAGADGGSERNEPAGAQQAGEAGQQIQDVLASLEFFEWALIGGVMAFVALMGVVALIIGTLVRGGANIYWLRLVRGQEARLSDTVTALRFFLPLLIATAVAGLGIGLGFTLLIIPGIILALGWLFFMQIVVDKNIGYLGALRASWRLTRGYKWDLFVFAILCLLLNFAGVLACGVGVIVTNAVVMGAVVVVYDRIAEPGNAYLD